MHGAHGWIYGESQSQHPRSLHNNNKFIRVLLDRVITSEILLNCSKTLLPVFRWQRLE
jgi:hypothetical protein